MGKLIIDIHHQEKHVVYKRNYASINVHTSYTSLHYFMKSWLDLGLMSNAFKFQLPEINCWNGSNTKFDARKIHRWIKVYRWANSVVSMLPNLRNRQSSCFAASSNLASTVQISVVVHRKPIINRYKNLYSNRNILNYFIIVFPRKIILCN